MGSVAAFSPQSHSLAPDQHVLESSFSERIALLLQRIDYQVAESDAQRQAIFRQRYQAYLRDGTIAPNATGTFSDADDDSDNAYLVGVHFDGELAGSIRIHVGCKDHPEFPSLEVFPDVLQSELDAGKVIIDSTRFVADASLSRLHRGLPYATMRIGWMAAEHFNAEHLLAAVRSEHQAFYRRTFGHRLICGPRPYPQLAKPITLMTVCAADITEQVHRRFPFFRSTLFERRSLFARSAPKRGSVQQPAAGVSTDESASIC